MVIKIRQDGPKFIVISVKVEFPTLINWTISELSIVRW